MLPNVTLFSTPKESIITERSLIGRVEKLYQFYLAANSLRKLTAHQDKPNNREQIYMKYMLIYMETGE